MNTLEKCVRILTLFTETTPVLGVAEIAERLELPRSTAYRYISALKAHRFVEEVPGSAGYRLGGRILEMAATMARKPLREVALPHMERIARETGETVLLCGLRGHVGVCLEKVDGTHALRVSYELGDTYPLHAAATGKAILAFLEPSEQKAVIREVGLPRLTATTITSESRLDKELARIRVAGVAESDGESIAGTHGIAAPIVSPSGRVMGSIGISVPHLRAQEKNRERLARLVIDAARAISET
ncbi:MAG: IclR family transcriptional regulator [Candidatus Bipolaricaulota bacterium]